MSERSRVVILGGHGKVALLAISRFRDAGYATDAVIRNPEQTDDVKAAGGHPVVLDMEAARGDEMAALFSGAAAIVFSAGAGGNSTPERTRAVDHDAAVRAMDAAEKAGTRRFVMVSYAGAATDVDRLDPDDAFYPYARAKHDADAYLRQSALDYTILGPGTLITEPASGKVQRAEQAGENWPNDRRVTSRANVAAMITHVIDSGAAIGKTVDFYDGDVPIAEAVGQHLDGNVM
jgi:uncharacterized protein YbjT (DUF2867 family)